MQLFRNGALIALMNISYHLWKMYMLKRNGDTVSLFFIVITVILSVPIQPEFYHINQTSSAFTNVYERQ